MTKTFLTLTAALLALALATQAQVPEGKITTQQEGTYTNTEKTGDSSVGLKWGDLTGVEFKRWSDEKNAWVLGFAFDNGNTAVGLDYIWHFRGGIASVTGLKNTNSLVPYIGVGVITAFGNEETDILDRVTGTFGAALRAPIGVEYLPTRLSLGLYAEVAPSFGVSPTSFTFMTADVGGRYYF